ncbi:unnamed protein product [Acanthoscelides obtectus]|uniref:Uncharacterized protein n=1 Tax=Acanthoscelides obtectus TaxID=200917 RepID=A0A9P0MJY2_ACAOB|nr:unnamed protein product [Acanthoscelides obtectus]CAK1654794.1 hypothetical protein AOBTE_LOCUS18846 [Acanthoscelides obtectus]
MIKESSSSSDEDLHVLCDDEEELDDDFSEGRGGETGGDFGKDNELWYRCVSCGSWSHALCSGYDSAVNYFCVFCM